MRHFRLAASFGPAPAGAVAARLWELAALPAAPDEAPGWLRPDQVRAYRRALAAVRRHGGACLALPPGAGKSYVALAVAAALGPGGADVIGPAPLRRQWERLGRDLGIAVRFQSHAQVSLGATPAGSGLVVIDESHHFRHPATRRYRVLAPALVGRPALLLSGTPVVNRPADLVAQLALAIRDDALAAHGVPSLAAAVGDGSAHSALALVLIRGEAPRDAPIRRDRLIPAPADPAFDRAAAAIDRLALARQPAIAALIRVSLLRALASSPAALLAALHRYRRLLGHAERARAAGRRLNRAALRTIMGDQPDQLVMWELIDHPAVAADLALGDRAAADRLARAAARWAERGDSKAGVLVQLTRDRVPTVVFATAVATVRYLRDRLAGAGVAWLTGRGAGFGPLGAGRGAVLAAFGPNAPAGVPLPWLLIASDVAAEGLNLQRIARVVHYDLPWTPERLTQRDGRAIRLGGDGHPVEVVRFEVAPAIEERLGLAALLLRKSGLVRSLAQPGSREREASGRTEDAFDGWAAVAAGPARAVAGFDNGWVLGRRGHGPWVDISGPLDGWLAGGDLDLASGHASPPPAEILASLDEAVRSRAGAWNARLLGGARPGGRRPWRLPRRAPDRMPAQPDLIRSLTRAGPTAGEAMLLAAATRGDHRAGLALGPGTVPIPLAPAFATPVLRALLLFKPAERTTTLSG